MPQIRPLHVTVTILVTTCALFFLSCSHHRRISSSDRCSTMKFGTPILIFAVHAVAFKAESPPQVTFNAAHHDVPEAPHDLDALKLIKLENGPPVWMTERHKVCLLLLWDRVSPEPYPKTTSTAFCSRERHSFV